MVPPSNLDNLSHAEPRNLVVALFEQVAELRRSVAAQADEIATSKVACTDRDLVGTLSRVADLSYQFQVKLTLQYMGTMSWI
jgi:hypothetical protein